MCLCKGGKNESGLSIVHQKLNSVFSKLDFEVMGSQAFRAQHPLSYDSLLDPLYENEEVDEEFPEDLVEKVTERYRIETKNVLTFMYFSSGPMSFSHGIFLLDVRDEFLYVVQFAETWPGNRSDVLLRFDRDQETVIIPVFLKHFYASNGTRYSDHEMFDSLPASTEVSHPCISIDLMKECYRQYLDGILKSYPNHYSWFGEAEESLEILNNPDVRERSLRAIQQVAAIPDMRSYLDNEQDDSNAFNSNIDEKGRELILNVLINYRTWFFRR